jgi:hypothetical protein
MMPFVKIDLGSAFVGPHRSGRHDAWGACRVGRTTPKGWAIQGDVDGGAEGPQVCRCQAI